VKAFTNYLGNDQSLWTEHDASRLIEAKGKLFDSILVDQGLEDQFLDQLHPDRLEVACARVGQPLNLRRHAGYDHGYYFIQSVIADHVRYHMQALR